MDTNKNQTKYEDTKVSTRVKLSALWASVTFCYLYGDYLGNFVPGFIQEVTAGNMGFMGPVTQETMLAGAMLMSLPCIMVFLSLVLPVVINRWTNIVMGFFYTGTMIVTLIMDSWLYYFYLGFIEVSLTLLVVWFAWSWPIQNDN